MARRPRRHDFGGLTDKEQMSSLTTAVRLRWGEAKNSQLVSFFVVELRCCNDKAQRGGKTAWHWKTLVTDPVDANSPALYEYLHSPLPPNTRIDYRIRAFNGHGASPYTKLSCTTAPSRPPPPTVTSLTTTSVKLRWSATGVPLVANSNSSAGDARYDTKDLTDKSSQTKAWGKTVGKSKSAASVLRRLKIAWERLTARRGVDIESLLESLDDADSDTSTDDGSAHSVDVINFLKSMGPSTNVLRGHIPLDLQLAFEENTKSRSIYTLLKLNVKRGLSELDDENFDWKGLRALVRRSKPVTPPTSETAAANRTTSREGSGTTAGTSHRGITHMKQAPDVYVVQRCRFVGEVIGELEGEECRAEDWVDMCRTTMTAAVVQSLSPGQMYQVSCYIVEMVVCHYHYCCVDSSVS